MMYGFGPYGPGMAGSEQGPRMGGGLVPSWMAAHLGGGLPAMQQPGMQTGGPMQPQGVMPPHMLTGGSLPPQAMGPQTGGALPPQAMPIAQTGGGMQRQPMQPNRLGGFVGGNFGMGGLLR